MIVKNEVANLERCLSSLADHISCWVIGDTGSTDGTQKLIERFFAARGIPGELHSFPFENFAQARNEALDRARASRLHFDYVLLTDADMELRVQNPVFSNNLAAAAYKVLQNSGVAYWNNRLLRRDVPASYRGVTHEYLDVRAGETKTLDGIRFIDHATGSNRVDKYERDVRLLTDAIATERDPGMIARYTFYLANTLRDSGQKEAALEIYLNRARQGNWQQEVFMSLLNVAKLKEELEYSNDEVIAAYMEANAACPARAEALHGAARFCRNRGIYEQGYDFAAQGLTISYPNDALFVEDWIYEYGLLDELAVNAYWTERYAECVAACDRLLSEGKLPTDQCDRVLKNKNFAVGKLGEAAAPSSLEAESFIKLLRVARQKEELIRPDEEVISAYMEATSACPTRAEALHGAARYCRVKGMHERGYEFAAQGLAIAYPKDALAVEDWIYEYGLQQEFSIVANYSRDPARKDRGFASCNWLALNRTVPEDPRNLALSNLHFYIEPAAKMMPSFASRPVGFAPPDGYRATNPSIACHGDGIVLVQRAVNYTIDQAMPDGDDRRYATPDGAPINTRNFLLRMDGDLAIRSSTEILPPEGMPKPVWLLAQGFEDLRPFVWRDGLWCIACVRELSHEGWCEQVLARIDERTPGASRLVDWRVLRPEGPQRHEKNWMPRVADDALQFIYLCDPTRLVDEQARTVAETIPPIAADQFRGGSQAIAFDGGWLALVHEARVRDKQRHYRHRFVWFDEASQLRRVSRPFFFHKRGVEFAAGLAWHPAGKRLVVTYGIEDCEAWIATVDADDVRCILENAEKLPSGELDQHALRHVTRTHSNAHAPVFSSADIPDPSSRSSYYEVQRNDNRPGSSSDKKTDISSGNPVTVPNGQAEPDTHHQKISGFSERPEGYDRIKYWLKGEPIQNFGDFLTELLLEKLFVGNPVKARHIHLIGSVISDPYVDLKHDEAVLLGNALDVGKVIFWGCGLRSEHSLSRHLRANVDFLAVRGPLTQKALDLPDTIPIGDPGLLLPALYQPRVLIKFISKSVCVPHFSDRRSDCELLRLSGCDLLLRTNIANSITAILEFIDAIVTADFVLSASLHGAIIAAAYGKPFAFWDNGFLDSPFKWHDFAASTNIQCRWFTSLSPAMDFFNSEIVPNLNIPVLFPLLLSAPLPVRQDVLEKVVDADIDRHGSNAFDFEIGLDDQSSMRIKMQKT